MHKLGRGILNWDSTERVSDRYGHVYLLAALQGDERVRIARPEPVPSRVRLIAVVEEVRTSRHIGDIFRGIFPSTPTPGEHITLGTGVLDVDGAGYVWLRPEDGRNSDWLDPHALYRAHEQTVTLYAEDVKALT